MKKQTSYFVTRPGQFVITFANGISLSIINHDGAYTEARNFGASKDNVTACATNTCEVGVFKGSDNSHFFQSDAVAGWQTPEDVAALVAKLANAKVTKTQTLRQVGTALGYNNGSAWGE
jgi:hypothetical protein